MLPRRPINGGVPGNRRSGAFAAIPVAAPGSTRNSNIFIVGSSVLIVIFLGIASTITQGIDYRVAMYSILGLLGLATIMGGEQSLFIGFVGFVAAFGLGYRTITVTPRLKIHPAEILILALLVLLFTARRARKALVHKMLIPGWMIAMLPFWIWGWFRGIGERYPWDDMLSESRNFFMLIPIVMVTSIMLINRDRWRLILTVLFITSTWIAMWGVAEYYVPGVRGLFPGFVTKTGSTITGEGFNRATYSFWGNPAATFLCAMAIPLAIPLRRWYPKSWQRMAITAMVLMQATGVYVGGFRILWSCVAVQFAIYAVLKKRYISAAVVVLLFLGVYNIIPASTQERFSTFAAVLNGKPSEHDSSGRKHLARLEEAVLLAEQNPMGVGWTGAGWVHCDFVQIAANLGWAGALVYLFAYIFTLWRFIDRISRTRKGTEYHDVLIAVLLGFTTVGALLWTQAVSVLPQLAYPAWFYWIMAEILSRQSDFERRKPSAPPALHTPADREFRSYRPQYAGVRELGR